MYGVHVARPKTINPLSDPKRQMLLKLIEERGPLTQGQLRALTGMQWGPLQWHLYVLEREGKVKRVEINGVVHYASPVKTALL